MKTVYLDSDFKCHLANDGTMIEYKTDFFDDMNDNIIQYYRIIPEGKTWVRKDGQTFSGLIIATWGTSERIAQLNQQNMQTELSQLKEQIADMESALKVLGVNINE